MDIEIKKLTPGLAEDYARFFEVTPHDDRTHKDELPCYCVTWRSDASYAEDNRSWIPTREERRERAVRFIKDGGLQGYLAYHGDRIVGWCNANGDCKSGLDYLRSFWPIAEYSPDIKVKSIFCFVIAPDMQRKGIATKLVGRVCEDAAGNGFDFAEAYVHEAQVPYDFRGPVAMFEKCGFIKSAAQDGRVVVRKALK